MQCSNKGMKVLFVVRPYSGLEKSLISSIWSPAGVPAIYKMLEALAKRPHRILAVFTCKDYERNLCGCHDETVHLRGLGIKVEVLAGKRVVPHAPAFFSGYLRELRQAFRIYHLFREFKPDLLYFDRANFLPASLFARWCKRPVVLRLMGVGTPFMRNLIHSRGFTDWFSRWAFRSPFASVICTQDGSGVEKWMEEALCKGVRSHLLLNGADSEPLGGFEHPSLSKVPRHGTVVLFVGRLEELKGCREFMRGFLIAWKEEPVGIHALVVGTGSLLGSLREMVSLEGANDSVTFTGELPHEQIAFAHIKSHIYVSLNRGGNLSNANLEAMKAGLCMILPRSCPETGVDTVTDQILPIEAGYRIPHVSDAPSLAKAILHLHRNPAERRARAHRTAAIARQSIPTWKERVETELTLLQGVIANSIETQETEEMCKRRG